MPRKQTIDLRFPIGGLNKGLAYQHQPPFTTPAAENVRPSETLEDRERGGSRPGLTGVLPTDASDGKVGDSSNRAIRMMEQVRVVRSDDVAVWRDDFAVGASAGSDLQGNWTVPSFTADGIAEYGTIGDEEKAGRNNLSEGDGIQGALLTPLTDFDATANYEMNTLLDLGGTGNFMFIYLLITDGGSNTNWYDSGGIQVRLDNTGAGRRVVFTAYSDAAALVDTSTSAITPGVTSEEVTLTYNPTTKVLTATWGGLLLLSHTYTGGDALGTLGSGIAFESQPLGVNDGGYLRHFEIQYSRDVDADERKTYVAVGDELGDVWYNNNQNTLTLVNATGGTPTGGEATLATDRPVQGVDYLQKLYLADYGLLSTGSDGASNDADVTFTSAGATWTTTPVPRDEDHALVVKSGTSVTAGTYEIASVTDATNMELSTEPTPSGETSSSVVYRLERQPKIFDPTAATAATQLVKWTATTGTVPIGCPLIAVFRDRIVMGGQSDQPHVWYMSRQGDPLDFNFGSSATDVQRAIAATNIEAGRVGSPITAMWAHSDDYFLFGSDTEMFILRGDPAVGGSLDRLSDSHGVVGMNAWCKGPSGESVWLSRQGLFGIPGGAGQFPTALSEALPQELQGLSPQNHLINLEYDVVEEGVHIFVTPLAGSGGSHFWFDWKSKGFWPVSLQTAHEPTATLARDGITTSSDAVLLGGSDGLIRRFTSSAQDDAGTSITNSVMYGPFPLGGPNRKGAITRLSCVLDGSSGDVTWSVHVGDTPEIALAATAFRSGTFSAGLNNDVILRAGGGSAFVKLTGSGTTSWAIETLLAERIETGRLRK